VIMPRIKRARNDRIFVCMKLSVSVELSTKIMEDGLFKPKSCLLNYRNL